MTIDYKTLKENRKKAKRSHGINAGSVSLIMIFTVLCLAVFAILTLVSANAEYELAKKYSASVSEYYETDSAAAEFISSIQSKTNSGTALETLMADIESDVDGILLYDGVLYIDKIFEISEKAELTLSLEVTADKVDIVVYKMTPISDESELQGGLNLWPGF